ncbi:MAG: hypothetical protein K2K66_03145 [Ruminococcus sp.]|nr:hypothetical protein [Ruminococcus sp.]
MKKFTLIFTALMCICVSCENKSDFGDSDAVQEKTLVTEIITQVPEVVSNRKDGYDEIIKSYRECMENSNLGNMMQLSYPDKYFEIFSFMTELSGLTVGELMGTMQSYNANTICIKDIISDEIMTDTKPLEDMLLELYGEYQAISDYIDEQGGTDNLDNEKFNDFMDNAEFDKDNINLYFKPDEVHILKCNMESTIETDDEPIIDEYEQEFVVYYIDGEGWKMDTYSETEE